MASFCGLHGQSQGGEWRGREGTHSVGPCTPPGVAKCVAPTTSSARKVGNSPILTSWTMPRPGAYNSCMRRLLIGGFAAGVMLVAGPASSQVAKDEVVRSTGGRTPEALAQTPGSRVRASCERPVRASSGASEDRLAPASPAPAAITPALPPDPVVEKSAFEHAARRFAKLRTFTNRLEVTREQREFERAATRYEKLRDFTDKLQAQRDRDQEQAFNQHVSTHLRKQAFTNRLLENRARLHKRD